MLSMRMVVLLVCRSFLHLVVYLCLGWDIDPTVEQCILALLKDKDTKGEKIC